MQKTQIYNQLRKLELASWPTLLVGFDIGLISKNDIEDYALFFLNKDKMVDQNIALLADAHNYNKCEIKSMISSQTHSKTISKNHEIEKIRLAALVDLCESKIPEKKKCDKLQELYTMFNYPDDMSECSIYSDSKISPLNAMHNLILLLNNKLLSKQRRDC